MVVPNKVFNLTYLGVTTLAKARLAPPKTQVKTAFGGPCGRCFFEELLSLKDQYFVFLGNSHEEVGRTRGRHLKIAPVAL